MKLFFSAGEPSGDQHGASLIRALARRDREFEASGFGGPAMQQAGCKLDFQLTDLAVMGISQVLPLLGKFWGLYRRAGKILAERRPDGVVLIDFPGFNWWVAKAAKRAGIPVYYYCPPQLWAWGQWRLRKVRKYVDHVLSVLPFEADWYAQREIKVSYVGHPFFDEVAEQKIDGTFSQQISEPGTRNLAILPGSRRQEVERNFPVMLEVMRRVRDLHGDVRFRVACFKASQQEFCQRLYNGWQSAGGPLPIDFYIGRTPEVIRTAECCLMVSGSVSLEVLAQAKPTVVMYRANLAMSIPARMLIRCRYMSLPNLIAGQEIMPEFPFDLGVKKRVTQMSEILNRWLGSKFAMAQVAGQMSALRDSVVKTGGVARAAEVLTDELSRKRFQRVAA